MTWISNRKHWADLIGKKVRIVSAAKDVLSGSNGCSGKFGDEEASMLRFDGKGIAHFTKRGTGVAEDA